ncbi:MAG TPA: DUF4340 domain-containing protein [Polyangiaceae bacterium]|nr:DUF4340 domain-containing protein [Polyangiaceae bacterium]
MKATKGLFLHVGLFVAASATALVTASASREPSDGRRVEAELWPGPADALSRINYEAEGQKTTILPAKDSVGRYAVVEVTKAAKPPLGVAGGGPDASAVAKPPETKRFISVDEAEKLLAAMAPAKSYRSLGKIEPSRLVDYGLDKPESRFSVEVGGKTYRLEVGALTPGSGDYYVRDPDTGQVHTFSAEQIGKLKFSDSRLLEHDLHGFNTDDVRAVEVLAGGKKRRAVRVEGKPNAWADPATPTVADETVGNWLLKVQRLHPQNYVENPVDLPANALVRVEYYDQKGKVGYLELFRATGAEKKYLARSERTRWYVDIPPSAAEPIEQDVNTIVK